MRKMPDTWQVVMSDKTEFELGEDEYKFFQQAVQSDKKVIFLRGKAINTSYIKYITRVEGITVYDKDDIVPQLPARTKKSLEQLKVDYEDYRANKQEFKQRLLSGNISGFPSRESKEYYLKHNYKEGDVSLEEFVSRYERDHANGEQNIYMQEYWF